jgi:hypothetical protein
MGLTNTYVQGYGKIEEFFNKIRDGQAPEQFTHQLLKDLGFTSTNDRQFIQLLKALGFLSPDGKPTSRYHIYRDHSKSKDVLGEALREAYHDIFLIKTNPTKDDKEAIHGKFLSYHNTTDRVAQLMTNTFLALLPISSLNIKTKLISEKKELEPSAKPKLEKDDINIIQPHHEAQTPELHYNIQIHLPATKDVEVYNAIFKSLKEHLFEK